MHTLLIPIRPLLTLGILMIGAACSPGKTDRSADSAGAEAMMGAAPVDSGRMAMPAGADDRRVVTALIADCEQMMRELKMEPPRKWRDAVHELRTDLDRMTNMTGAQLEQAMPEHRKRIEGMLAMRSDMMRM
ncbi:MAG: hypothetical protein LH467_12515 [Gemmatimonadaceae bacterium]|nr:hypothetical protein [Gemmatimonadaceae bacterium]